MHALRSLRYRFGVWRRDLRRRRRAPVRLLPESRRSEEVTVSVVVPVKNAGPELTDLIVHMKEQRGFRGVEIVIVDSGSTDGSAETAEALGATVVRIAPQDFSHSYARNLGAERATGDYVLFTVQDALPSSERWLHEMFSALKRYEAAAVSCGEEPRPDSDLFYRAISWNHHRFMSVDGRDAVLFHSADDTPMERRRSAQISDTACLIRRDLFLRYRHRGEYAEDLDLGLRLTSDAYRLVFLASSRIIHSHNRPAFYHLKRCYVEQLALFDMLTGFPSGRGDEASVTTDIVRSCRALDALIRGPLRALALPRSPQELHDAVTAGLRAKPSGDPVATATPRDYLDDGTRAFVARLQYRSAAGGGPERPQDSLVEVVAGVAGLICAYLDDSGQTLDGARLEEFKAALYKGWAQHCGLRLASVYWRGPAAVRDSLRAVHEELTGGV